MNLNNNFIIATRKSKLALWQANYIKSALELLNTNYSIDILGLTTRGDETQAQNIALSKIGGKALFTKELEQAIYDKKAHCAVHSLKDVPMSLPIIENKQFFLGAILKREDVRDAFISKKYKSLEQMPHGSIIGTSSLRRSSIIKYKYPYLNTQMIRGNIDTRLAKLDNNEFDAIILASAGLKRLGLEYRITQYVATEIMLPCAGQAALAVEIYDNQYLNIINSLNHMPTFLACTAERQVSLKLGGSCQVPLAAYAFFKHNILNLEAWVLSQNGDNLIKVKMNAEVNNNTQAIKLGNEVASELIEQGALEILNIM